MNWKKIGLSLLTALFFSVPTLAAETPLVLTFDACGGISSLTEKSYAADAALGVLPLPSLDGFAFDGWYTKPSGGERVYAQTRAEDVGDTLYAHWSPTETFLNVYNVRTTLTLAVGETAPLVHTVTALDGVSIRTVCTDTDVIDVTENGTVTAVSEGSAEVTVTFVYSGLHYSITSAVIVVGRSAVRVTLYPNGGTSDTEEKTVYYGLPYGQLPTPTRAGYSFDGWYTDPIAGERVSGTDTVERRAAHGLYARWTAFEKRAEGVYVRKDLALDIGEQATVNEWVYADRTLSYVSEDENIASVAQDGLVTAKAVGNTSLDVFDNGEALDGTAVTVSGKKAQTTVYFDAKNAVPDTPYITRPRGERYGVLATLSAQDGFIGWVDARNGTPVLPSDTVKNTAEQTLCAMYSDRKFVDWESDEQTAPCRLVYWGILAPKSETAFGADELPTAAEGFEAVSRLLTLLAERDSAQNDCFVQPAAFSEAASRYADSESPLTFGDACTMALIAIGKTPTDTQKAVSTAKKARLTDTISEKYEADDRLEKKSFTMLLSALFDYIPTDGTVLLGDVNGDGVVNVKDNMMLARFLAGWDGYETIDKKAADLNTDGKVNVKDNMVLARHLAGWDGYETLPYGETDAN